MVKANLKQIIRSKYYSMLQEAHCDHNHQTLVNTVERDLIIDRVEEGTVLRERFDQAILLSDLMSRVDEIRLRKGSQSKRLRNETPK